MANVTVQVGTHGRVMLWDVAALTTEIGYDLDDVAQHNLEKLAARKARNAINGTGDKR